MKEVIVPSPSLQLGLEGHSQHTQPPLSSICMLPPGPAQGTALPLRALPAPEKPGLEAEARSRVVVGCFWRFLLSSFEGLRTAEPSWGDMQFQMSAKSNSALVDQNLKLKGEKVFLSPITEVVTRPCLQILSCLIGSYGWNTGDPGLELKVELTVIGHMSTPQGRRVYQKTFE